MHKRFLATTVITTALLLSQEGSLLVAALCPHLQSGMASCEADASASKSGHEAMSHDDMGHMGHAELKHEQASQPDANALALGQPIDLCEHCSVHSRKNQNTASLRETEAAKRSADLTIPLDSSRIAPVSVVAVPVLTSRAHGPPGGSTRRHILINIFRI
jgi:hypothetical protein